MAALIRCLLHLDPKEMSEDEFCEAWGQVKYYLETVSQVQFFA
jgi:hypothetical protein